MYHISGQEAIKIESVNFSDLQMKEKDVEEILRNKVEMLCGDEEALLIVGRQVRNDRNGISDLVAIDQNGDLILIEIKRDRKDIEQRVEPFEFQAIRYAAAYARISDIDKLVTNVYAPYIEKHCNESELNGLTSHEFGLRKLRSFLADNGAVNSFNQMQKIILVASDYDPQTLSAVAWLNNNGVNISCFKLVTYKVDDKLIIYPEKVLPLPKYEDYYVNVKERSTTSSSPFISNISSLQNNRKSFPKIREMLSWGVVKPGDIIKPVNKATEIYDVEAVLCQDGNVEVDGEIMSMQVWLQKLYGWSSVPVYVQAIHKESGKTLAVIREEYMREHNL
jgi:Predicted nuclease of the RecB family